MLQSTLTPVPLHHTPAPKSPHPHSGNNEDHPVIAQLDAWLYTVCCTHGHGERMSRERDRFGRLMAGIHSTAVG